MQNIFSFLVCMCQKTTRATFHMKFLQRWWWKAWKEPKRQRIEMQQAYRHVAHGILLCYSHMFLTITYFFLCLSRNDSLYFSWLVPFFPKKKFEGVRFIIIPWKFQVWLETSHMFVLLCGTIGFGSSFSISCTLFYIIYCYPVINTIQEVIHFLSFILLKIVGAFFTVLLSNYQHKKNFCITALLWILGGGLGLNSRTHSTVNTL